MYHRLFVRLITSLSLLAFVCFMVTGTAYIASLPRLCFTRIEILVSLIPRILVSSFQLKTPSVFLFTQLFFRFQCISPFYFLDETSRLIIALAEELISDYQLF